LRKTASVAARRLVVLLLGACLGVPLAPLLPLRESSDSKPMIVTTQVIVGANVWTEENLTAAVKRGIEEGRKLQVELGKPVAFTIREIREDVWSVLALASVPGQPQVP